MEPSWGWPLPDQPVDEHAEPKDASVTNPVPEEET